MAFTDRDWDECLTITDAIPDAGGYDRYRRDFLRGLSLFHRGQYASSKEVFRRLDDESRNLSSRIISKYLASDPDGTPRQFTGRVMSATPDGRRGTAWVDQLHIEVPFIPLRFSVSDYRKKGEILPSFHIAFNMRGALADPITSRSARSRGGRPMRGKVAEFRQALRSPWPAQADHGWRWRLTRRSSRPGRGRTEQRGLRRARLGGLPDVAGELEAGHRVPLGIGATALRATSTT